MSVSDSTKGLGADGRDSTPGPVSGQCQRCRTPTNGSDVFEGSHRYFPVCVKRLQTRIAELEAALAEARKDTERLDRLESGHAYMLYRNRDPETWNLAPYHLFEDGGEYGKSLSIRGAIDALLEADHAAG